MRGIRAVRDPTAGFPSCCARATKGIAAALPRPVMNSRRLMITPRLRRDQCIGSDQFLEGAPAPATRNVRSYPNTGLVGKRRQVPIGDIAAYSITWSARRATRAHFETEAQLFLLEIGKPSVSSNLSRILPQ